jgi:hypothetical protein
VIPAQEAALAGQGVLVQVAGFGVAAHHHECPCKETCGRPSVLMIVAEPIAPLLVETIRQFIPEAAIAAR